jgi:hypothetical protein
MKILWLKRCNEKMFNKVFEKSIQNVYTFQNENMIE